MFSGFQNLDRKKQDRIINAALREFVQKGYDHASTNEMVKGAGISKGLLFHYFTNKKQLYLYLVDYCLEAGMGELSKKLNLREPDFFTRFREFERIKSGICSQYPEMFRFLQAASQESSDEVSRELEGRRKDLTASSAAKLFDGVDDSRFKEGLDPAKIIKIVMWSFEGFRGEQLQNANAAYPSSPYDPAQGVAEAEEFIAVLKACFYRKKWRSGR